MWDFELRYIGKPFFIWLLRMELAVQQIFSKILGSLCPSGTAVVIVFYGRADISSPADAQHSFVIDVDSIVMTQIIIQSPITFIRVFQIDSLNLIRQFLVLCSSVAQFPGCPFVVSGTGHMDQFASCLNRKPVFLMALFNGHIKVSLPYF